MALAPILLLFGVPSVSRSTLIDRRLVEGVHADDRGAERLVDVVDGLGHALAHPALLVAVAELERLVLARRRAARNGGTAVARGGLHLDFDGGVSARVEDGTREDE